MGRITIGDVYAAGARFNEVTRLRVENKRLAVDSVALGKIIKAINDWRTHNALDHAHLLIDEISDIIDECGDQ